MGFRPDSSFNTAGGRESKSGPGRESSSSRTSVSSATPARASASRRTSSTCAGTARTLTKSSA
jgi:hypothetical protein